MSGAFEEGSMVIPRYLNERQVADMTGLAVQTLRNWRFQRRGISYLKTGRSIRYSLADVVRFMERQRIEVESD